MAGTQVSPDCWAWRLSGCSYLWLPGPPSRTDTKPDPGAPLACGSYFFGADAFDTETLLVPLKLPTTQTASWPFGAGINFPSGVTTTRFPGAGASCFRRAR